jgi:hypothetical protein
MVLRKAHRIAVVRLARDASTHPPSRFIARERIFASMMVRSRQTGSTAGLERDDFSSNRHPALPYCWKHDLFRKPFPLFGIML